jgi:hypothetical protein
MRSGRHTETGTGMNRRATHDPMRHTAARIEEHPPLLPTDPPDHHQRDHLSHELRSISDLARYLGGEKGPSIRRVVAAEKLRGQWHQYLFDRGIHMSDLSVRFSRRGDDTLLAFSHPRSKHSDDLHWPAVLDGSTSGLTPVPIDASTADRRSAQFDLTQQSWAGHKSVTKRPAVPGYSPRLSTDEVLECRAGVKEPLTTRPTWHGEACPLWTEVRGGRKTSPPASDTYSTPTNVSLTMIGPTRNGQLPRHLTTAEASQLDKHTGVHADIPTRIPTRRRWCVAVLPAGAAGCCRHARRHARCSPRPARRPHTRRPHAHLGGLL